MEYFEILREIDDCSTEQQIYPLEERINKLPKSEQSQLWQGILARFPNYQSPKRELPT